jgi:FkbM family methyltransferase
MLPAFVPLLIMLRIAAWLRITMEVKCQTSAGNRFMCRLPDLIQLYLWLFDIWEPDLTEFIQRRLAPGDGFIDVGANIGYFTALAARRVGRDGDVIAIEASPNIFARLSQTLAMNADCQGVRSINKAAAATTGAIDMFAGPEHNIGLTTTVRRRGMARHATIEAMPLDDLLEPAEVRRARLIKIDVEGGEDAVLAGMSAILRDGRPDLEVLVELSPLWWSDPGKRPIDVLRPLLDQGFHIYEIDNDYWPWRYLWPGCARRPRRCQRDLTQRVKRLDLVFSREDTDDL